MTHPTPARPEQVFTYGAPQLKFGPGSSDEIGYDLSTTGATRALVVTDSGIAASGGPRKVADQMSEFGVDSVIFDGSHVEPTDRSMAEAVAFARENGPFDAIVAVGGGSSIDTAKAVNLMLTNDGDLLDYVNAPVGGGKAPTSPLLPLIAVPTTTGTGAESTTVCVLDVLDQHVKSGISHARLRPMMAVIDPELTVSQPPMVTASAGMDILCHALESYTARPYTTYEHKAPEQRVPYCGSNPIADMWCEKALDLMSGSFRTAVADGANTDARGAMAMAATFAGMGFGNAGVHLPHANAYPIAGQVKGFRPDGYPGDEAMVPHGMAVALTAPAAFRFTFDAAPERHLAAARRLAPDATHADDRELLPSVLVALYQDIGIPNGLAAVGFSESDLDALVEGTMKQQRLLTTAPRPVGAADAREVLAQAMHLW
ncbi:alcohol dehydrogenase class IV [Barrientosiimonas humi]|uniref:hydroxyacid-oxoacid transhydrogenase n=1 Tax=Barrientosiimonas humi TaxID=999931 RepID=A0A542XEW9_9MICO|nr:hydroxyacid-oxoacid transhydrogenase [Barrientosiimonas humi]TQL34365.1 alcohol dehydrogenase class IV [Barrientosiimonas humi]CAG7574356.1 NAD-dependent methanol dehydrogenase [Barrientosiimonas humi]